MKELMEQKAVAVPNGYDLSFLEWFRAWGWRINDGLDTVTVWADPSGPRCGFTVTRGMIERLAAAGELVRIFPAGDLWTECWVKKNT